MESILDCFRKEKRNLLFPELKQCQVHELIKSVRARGYSLAHVSTLPGGRRLYPLICFFEIFDFLCSDITEDSIKWLVMIGNEKQKNVKRSWRTPSTQFIYATWQGFYFALDRLMFLASHEWSSVQSNYYPRAVLSGGNDIPTIKEWKRRSIEWVRFSVEVTDSPFHLLLPSNCIKLNQLTALWYFRKRPSNKRWPVDLVNKENRTTYLDDAIRIPKYNNQIVNDNDSIEMSRIEYGSLLPLILGIGATRYLSALLPRTIKAHDLQKRSDDNLSGIASFQNAWEMLKNILIDANKLTLVRTPNRTKHDEEKSSFDGKNYCHDISYGTLIPKKTDKYSIFSLEKTTFDGENIVSITTNQERFETWLGAEGITQWQDRAPTCFINIELPNFPYPNISHATATESILIENELCFDIVLYPFINNKFHFSTWPIKQYKNIAISSIVIKQVNQLGQINIFIYSDLVIQ